MYALLLILLHLLEIHFVVTFNVVNHLQKLNNLPFPSLFYPLFLS